MFTDEQLLRSDFDTQAYLRYVLHASADTAAAERRRLVACAEQLRSEMRAQLAEHTDDVLAHVQATHAAQRAIATASQHSSALTAAMARLRLLTVDTHATLRSQVAELDNTYTALGLVRAVLDYVALVARLHVVVAPPQQQQQQQQQQQVTKTAAAASDTSSHDATTELVRVARTLHDMDVLLRTHALRDFDVVQRVQHHVERVTASVRSRALGLLAMRELLQHNNDNNNNNNNNNDNKATASSSLTATAMGRLVSDVSTALHCFYLLGGLARTIASVMGEHKREALRCIARDLDVERVAAQLASVRQRAVAAAATAQQQQQQHYRTALATSADEDAAALHGGGGSTASVTAAVEEALLTCVQRALDMAMQHTRCVLLLWRVLLSRSDATTGVCYVATLLDDASSSSSNNANNATHAPQQHVQLLVDYWTSIMERVRVQLTEWQRHAGLLAALVHGYPRLHTQLRDCVTPACRRSNSSNNSSAAIDAMTLAALAVRQGTMGDYLDLIDDVRDACVRCTSTSTAATMTPAAHDTTTTTAASLRATWLRQVTAEPARRFAAQLLERHRQPMQTLLSRLSVLTPTSVAVASQAAATTTTSNSNNNANSYGTTTLPPHGAAALPVEAHTLNIAAYIRVALHDVHTHRREPHALHLTLQTMLVCLTQLQARVQECAAACPLPPLPSVTSHVTRGQLLHLCIANLCTALACDLNGALTLLPPELLLLQQPLSSSSSSSGVAAVSTASDDTTTAPMPHVDDADDGSDAAHDDGDAIDDARALAAALRRDRRQLHELVQSYSAQSRQSSHPFLHSAASLLLLATTQCVRGFVVRSSNDDNNNVDVHKQTSEAVLGQLRVHVRHFLTRYYVAVDTRTAGWCELARRTGDALLARLLVHVACATLDEAVTHVTHTTNDNNNSNNSNAVDDKSRAQQRDTATAAAATSDVLPSSSCAPRHEHERPWLLACLRAVTPVLVEFVHATQAGGMARSTLLLKGYVRHMQRLYGDDDNDAGDGGERDARSACSNSSGAQAAWSHADALVALLQPLCPLLARTLLLQHVWWQVRDAQQHDDADTTASGATAAVASPIPPLVQLAKTTRPLSLSRLVDGVEAAVLQCSEPALYADASTDEQQQQQQALQDEAAATLQACLDVLLPHASADVAGVVRTALQTLPR